MAFAVALPCHRALRPALHARTSILLPVRPRRTRRCATPPRSELSPEDEQAVQVARARDALISRGVDFDNLLNSSKVVTLWYELETLRNSSDTVRLERVTAELERESRAVMGTVLRRTFEIQAILLCILGGVLATDAASSVFGHVPLVGRALGFWMVWLFTIPSLRARKGTRKFEKSALNVAFLGMPFVNLALGSLTRNTGAIWGADVIFLVGCFVYYGVRSSAAGETREEGRVTGVLKYLDWGSWR